MSCSGGASAAGSPPALQVKCASQTYSGSTAVYAVCSSYCDSSFSASLSKPSISFFSLSCFYWTYSCKQRLFCHLCYYQEQNVGSDELAIYYQSKQFLMSLLILLFANYRVLNCSRCSSLHNLVKSYTCDYFRHLSSVVIFNIFFE